MSRKFWKGRYANSNFKWGCQAQQTRYHNEPRMLSVVPAFTLARQVAQESQVEPNPPSTYSEQSLQPLLPRTAYTLLDERLRSNKVSTKWRATVVNSVQVFILAPEISSKS